MFCSGLLCSVLINSAVLYSALFCSTLFYSVLTPWDKFDVPSFRRNMLPTSSGRNNLVRVIGRSKFVDCEERGGCKGCGQSEAGKGQLFVFIENIMHAFLVPLISASS
jgi:hypothetical protein